jgi:hypothetical protein
MFEVGRFVYVGGRVGGVHRKTRSGRGGWGGGGLGCTHGVDRMVGEGNTTERAGTTKSLEEPSLSLPSSKLRRGGRGGMDGMD